MVNIDRLFASDRFAFCDPPIPGESLMGFVARNADKHGVPKLSTALLPTGIDSLVPDSLPTVHFEKAPEVARVFGTSVEEVRLRCHPSVTLPGRHRAFIGFFGTSVRSAYRESCRRRVSPVSLAASPHHRAVWDLRVLGFCPESKETLIDACPACGKTLGWRWTVGVAWCESEDCGSDLREFPQPRVSVDDMEALDFVTDLVHWDAERRACAVAKVPPALSFLDGGELFEGCIAIACAATTETEAPRAIMRRLKKLEDFGRMTPEALALAGRTLLDWPKTYHRIADRMRDQSVDREGHWGVKKELGPLWYLAHDPYLSPKLKEAIKRENGANMAASADRMVIRRAETRAAPDKMTVGDAEKELGLDGRMIKRWRDDGLVWSHSDETARQSIVLLKREEMAAIAAARDDAVWACIVTGSFGIDRGAASALAEAGLIERLERPAADLIKGINYRKSTVDALRARLMACARPPAPDCKLHVRLSKAVKRAGVDPVPWPAIYQAILSGALKVHLHPGRGNVTIGTSLAVSDAAEIAPIIRAATGAQVDRSERLNTEEAAVRIGTTEAAVSMLIATGALRTNGRTEWKVDRAAVEEFKHKYVMTREVAQRMGCRGKNVRKLLLKDGVAPAFGGANGQRLLWLRAEVEKVIG